jgi:Tfp pilus assembly protein PilN
MRPVNLLPARHRPRIATAGGARAYILLGVLALVLAAAVVYVHTVNQVRSNRSQAAKLDRESDTLEARARALSPYTEFAAVAKTRIGSVRALAASRFDWERLVREVSRVLPKGTWLKKVEASTKPATDAGASSAASSDGGAAGGTTGPTEPAMQLEGCAIDQRDVAVMMVRLRQLHQGQEVVLQESKRPEGPENAGETAVSEDGCGAKNGVPNLEFRAHVTFKPTALTGAGVGNRAPAALGGGQ